MIIVSYIFLKSEIMMKEAILAFVPLLVEFLFLYTVVFTLFLLVLSVQLIHAQYNDKSVWWETLDAMTMPPFKNPCSFLEVSFYMITCSLFSLGLWSLFKIEFSLIISVLFQFSSLFAFCMGVATILLKRKTV